MKPPTPDARTIKTPSDLRKKTTQDNRPNNHPNQESILKMLSTTIMTSLILGLSQLTLTTGAALREPSPPTGLVITHKASDYFPHTKGDLTPFDVDVRYVGYPTATETWLSALNPHSSNTDEDKARTLTEAAYAKKYDENDADMASDVAALLAHVAGNGTETKGLSKRSSFSTSAAHAVLWSACGTFFSCISGTTCSFSQEIGQAPRSHCEQHGGSNCCVSWSNYNVRAGFFSTTWTACNEEVKAEGKTSASCEGYGSGDQGGDVCLSNRATGCT